MVLQLLLSRNKLDLLKEQDKGNADLLIASEAKLGISFVSARLKFCGSFSSFQLDRDDFNGTIKAFVSEMQN